jgi:hypothetical protein
MKNLPQYFVIDTHLPNGEKHPRFNKVIEILYKMYRLKFDSSNYRFYCKTNIGHFMSDVVNGELPKDENVKIFTVDEFLDLNNTESVEKLAISGSIELHEVFKELGFGNGGENVNKTYSNGLGGDCKYNTYFISNNKLKYFHDSPVPCGYKITSSVSEFRNHLISVFNLQEKPTNTEPRLGFRGGPELIVLLTKLGLIIGGENTHLTTCGCIDASSKNLIYHLTKDKKQLTFTSTNQIKDIKVITDINEFEAYLKEHLDVSEIKHLPKYFVIKWSDDPRWETYIQYLNDTYNADFKGSLSSNYYGHDGTIKLSLGHGPCSINAFLSYFQNNPVVLTLDEFFEFQETKDLLNKKLNKKEEMTKISVKKSDLGRIHDIACDNWKIKIDRLASLNLYSDSVELTKDKIDEMFKAASPSQLLVLEEIFGEQFRSLNFYNDKTIDFKVDGIKVFGNSKDSATSAFIGLPGLKADYFILNDNYDWKIEGKSLKLTRKK